MRNFPNLTDLLGPMLELPVASSPGQPKTLYVRAGALGLTVPYAPHWDDPENFTFLDVYHTTYIIPMSVKELEELIDNA